MHHVASNQELAFRESTMIPRVHYGQWLLRLIAWDGVLPVLVMIIPWFVQLQFPNRPHALELVAIVVPITAFFIRFFVARRHICSNHCTRIVRVIQTVALCLAILVLLMVDSLIILACEMPKGALFATSTDRMIWAGMYAFYLTCMAIALYPGLSVELEAIEWDDHDFEDAAFPESLSAPDCDCCQ